MNLTFPTSIHQAGLFALTGAPVRFADLLPAIPVTAIVITVRATGSNAAAIIVTVDGCAKDARLLPEQSVELTLADLETHSVQAESEDDSIVVTFTRPMGDK